MAKFRVHIKGTNNFIRLEEKRIRNLSDRQLSRIASDTKDAMQTSIQASITRANSSGNLENSITAVKTVFGWGIGDINFMNQVAPYWRHVNFGSEAIGASHSHLVPQGAFNPGGAPVANGGGGRWTVGGGSHSFIPSKPIAPLNYIAKTLQSVPGIISRGIRF